MDGVLVSSFHRYKTDNSGKKIDLEFWRKHDIPEFIEKDSLLPHSVAYKADLKDTEVYVILATARACIKNDANYTFIHKHLGMPNKFIHRQGVNDNRHGHTIKIQGIKPLLNLKQFKDSIVHVFEDNATYLEHMCNAFSCNGNLIYSEQRF
jgi:hypothetical protein